MPAITLAEATRQVDRLQRRAEQVPRTDVDDVVAAWRAVLAHPCAAHLLFTYEVLDDLHQTLRHAGRYDEAIAAKREAIAAGYDSIPDPEADIAEMLVEAGRSDQAAALFATLRDRDPDDVWLYNSAAWAYGGRDPALSLRWAREGIDVALATGDPDQVVTQLVEFAEAAWTALGEAPDRELLDTVRKFDASGRAARRSWRTVDAEPSLLDDLDDEDDLDDAPVCDHCGYDPDALLPARPGPSPSTMLRPGSIDLAFAWFPADEWAVATDRWPDLTEERPADHTEYSHQTEARIKMFAALMPGQPVHIAALTVPLLEEWAAAHDGDPGSAEMRAELASEQAGRGAGLPWPPGRNAPCWCGSTRKYKKCCGPVPAHVPEE